jgi:pimeloyl-ACP methyl ester carboxylesterase
LLARAASRTALALIVFAAGASPAFAQPLPLPAPVQEMLEKFGGLLPDRAVPFLGDWKTIYQAPVRNDQFAALMERARSEDEVVPLTHALFAPETAATGLWHSAFYLENYGTAIFLAAPLVDGRIPVLLIPGIGGSPRDFAELVPRLQRAGYQPLYFVYPSGVALRRAADELGERLQDFLKRHEIDRFFVIGHSMGGVVAKALLDEIDVTDDLPGWRLFIAISSPFGGVHTAQFAHRMPQHPPAWDDLSPESAFIHSIQSTRIPPDLRFYVFFGARSSKRYMAALGNNDGVLTIDSMCGSPVSEWASDVFGFYENHTSILAAPLVFSRIEHIFQAELER